MNKSGEEDKRQRRSIVLEKDADVVLEQAAGSQLATNVSNHEDQQRSDNGQVKSAVISEALKHLDSLLKIDKGNVEAKDVAGEACHPAQPVARVCDGEDPVQDKRPYTDPSHETNVVDPCRLHNVVDSVVEDGNRACDTNNDERLRSKDGEDNAAKHG